MSGLNYMHESSELKSHSSALTNERINAIIAVYDTEILQARGDDKMSFLPIERAFNTAHILWNNIRTLVRSDTNCRRHLELETKTAGVYILDVYDQLVQDTIDMIKIKRAAYTFGTRRTLLRRIEYMVLVSRDILNYFQFNFRTEKRNTPDLLNVSDQHFEPDENTVRQLAGVVGKRNKIDFERFGKQLNTEFMIGEEPDEDDEDEY